MKAIQFISSFRPPRRRRLRRAPSGQNLIQLLGVDGGGEGGEGGGGGINNKRYHHRPSVRPSNRLKGGRKGERESGGFMGRKQGKYKKKARSSKSTGRLKGGEIVATCRQIQLDESDGSDATHQDRPKKREEASSSCPSSLSFGPCFRPLRCELSKIGRAARDRT